MEEVDSLSIKNFLFIQMVKKKKFIEIILFDEWILSGVSSYILKYVCTWLYV